MSFKKILLCIKVLLILFITLVPVYAETGEEWVEKGDKFLKKSNFEEAIKCYDKALEIARKERKETTDASYYLQSLVGKGLALVKQGKHIEGSSYFVKTLHIKPNYVYAIYADGISDCVYADYSVSNNDLEEALRFYKLAIHNFDRALEIDQNYKDAEIEKQKVQDIINTMVNTDNSKKPTTIENNKKKINAIKTEDLKKLTININNCYYTGEKQLKNGILYVILTDFKNFANNNYINFDYKFDGNKLIIKDSVGEYEFKDPFIKDGYDVYIPLIDLCKHLKFSYDYNSDKYLLNINKSLDGISAGGLSLSNNLIVPNGQIGKLQLYSTKSQVIQYLGSPDSNQTLKNNSYAMYYSEYDLAITYDTSYVVRAILTQSSYYKDCYGIGVGCDIEKAFDCYSGGYYSKNPSSYTNPNRGILFNYNYNNGKITSILVFDPGYINILFNYY